MTTTQIVMSAFAVVIVGLMLPLPSGIRSGLFLALVALAVLTFLGGGMHYITSLFSRGAMLQRVSPGGCAVPLGGGRGLVASSAFHV